MAPKKAASAAPAKEAAAAKPAASKPAPAKAPAATKSTAVASKGKQQAAWWPLDGQLVICTWLTSPLCSFPSFS